MPILSLCTGYGGLDMAVEALTGDKTAYFAETDPAACLVLKHHWPDTPNIGDITTYDFTQLRGKVDKIAAGFPCRNTSNAGRRDGINGEWSRVWKDVCRAVRDIRPRYAFLENVAALRSRGLDVVAEDLASIGYDLWWTTLRASDVGAAHQRDRWFGIAVPHAEGVGRPAWWAEPAQQQGEVRRPPGARSERAADADSGGRDGGPGDEPEPQGRDEPEDARHSPAGWWAEYLPAIRRWERLMGVPAPAPTELGPRGGRRLTARFAEWLMGISPGHVTAVTGLDRSEQLQRIGNGAMSQQAQPAYEHLLHLMKEAA